MRLADRGYCLFQTLCFIAASILGSCFAAGKQHWVVTWNTGETGVFSLQPSARQDDANVVREFLFSEKPERFQPSTMAETVPLMRFEKLVVERNRKGEIATISCVVSRRGYFDLDSSLETANGMQTLRQSVLAHLIGLGELRWLESRERPGDYTALVPACPIFFTHWHIRGKGSLVTKLSVEYNETNHLFDSDGSLPFQKMAYGFSAMLLGTGILDIGRAENCHPDSPLSGDYPAGTQTFPFHPHCQVVFFRDEEELAKVSLTSSEQLPLPTIFWRRSIVSKSDYQFSYKGEIRDSGRWLGIRLHLRRPGVVSTCRPQPLTNGCGRLPNSIVSAWLCVRRNGLAPSGGKA